MHLRRFQHRLITWLALVALGLLLVAPAISQVRMSMEPMLDMGASCAGHGMDHAHGMPSMPKHPGNGEACGYCVLLGQSPALTATFVAMVHRVGAMLPEPAASLAASPLLRSLPLHVRGPPALIPL
ncbi:DUF2946 family protein [Dyella sp. C11]|uniref:DUF2946 family protein n=1 Tax=Dyella sp. C11 TaxID=2126991 RepID=UPI000D65BF32|nr:DUF2946 family protein [Dyella sp. C11]